MKPILIIVLFSLVLAVSFTSSVYGYNLNLKADNPRTIEKEFYNVVYIDVHLTATDMKINDREFIPKESFTIVNENGEEYSTDSSECKIPVGLGLSGKENPETMMTVCYSVEKQFKNFKMYYSKEPYVLLDKKSLIGSFVLTPEMVQTLHDGEKYNVSETGKSSTSDENKQSSQTVNIKDKIQESTIRDFFSQLTDMLRSLFNFS